MTVISDAPVFAFALADGKPEWPEIVLALAAAFLVAYGIMLLVRRLLRWILGGVIGGEHPQPGAALQQSLFGAQLLIFLITWAAFSIVLLDGIGLPLDVGLGRGALRGWLLASGLRIALILVIAWLVLQKSSP